MKKFCFLICILTLFSSCSQKGNENKEVLSRENEPESSVYVHNLFEGTGLGNDNGYYYIDVQENGIQNIKYIDYDLQEEMYLCNDPDCSHCNETCTSVVIAYGGAVNVLPYENYIYILYTGSSHNSDYFEKYGEKAYPHIERSDPDGMNRENILTLSANEITEGNIAFTEKEIYLTIKTIEEENGKLVTKYYLNKYDIETGSCISEYLLDKNTSGIIGGIKDYLVLEFINDSRRDFSGITYSYSKFCITDNTICDITEVNPRKTNGFIIEDILYIVDTSENSLTAYNVNTMEKTIVTDRLTDNHALGGVFCHTNDGIVLLTYNNDECEVRKEYYDFKTNSTKEIQIETKFEMIYTADAPLILAENDSQYLIAVDNIIKDKGYYYFDGRVVVLQGPEYVMALITKDDYINGVSNYKIIEDADRNSQSILTGKGKLYSA